MVNAQQRIRNYVATLNTSQLRQVEAMLRRAARRPGPEQREHRIARLAVCEELDRRGRS